MRTSEVANRASFPGGAPVSAVRGSLATFASPLQSPIPRFEFSTRHLPVSQQFVAWRDSFAPMLELVDPGRTSDGFDGNQTLWDLGSLVFARIRADAVDFTSLAQHTRREPLDHWMLTLLLRGTMRTRTPNGALEVGPGLVQVHPLGRCFKGHATECEMLILFVPRDFSPEVERVLGVMEFSTLAGGMGQLFSDYVTRVAERLPMLESRDLPSLVAAIGAMIVACAAPSAGHVDAAQEPIATTLFARARRCIHAKLFDTNFDAETLRREMGISRTRLYRLFEPYGGVVHYIQHRRLIYAHVALADPSDQRLIVEIAEQHGFSDGTEFSRAFRREFAYSPSDARKGGRSSLPSKPFIDLRSSLADERLGKLLRRLHG